MRRASELCVVCLMLPLLGLGCAGGQSEAQDGPLSQYRPLPRATEDWIRGSYRIGTDQPARTLMAPGHAALFALDHLLPPTDEEIDWVAAAALYASRDLQRASRYMDQVMRTQSVAGATLAGLGSPGVSQDGGPPNPYGTALLFLHFDPTQAVPSWVVDFYRRRRDTRGSGWLAGRVYDQLTGTVPDTFDLSVLGPIPEDYFAFRGLYNNSVPTTDVDARRGSRDGFYSDCQP